MSPSRLLEGRRGSAASRIIPVALLAALATPGVQGAAPPAGVKRIANQEYSRPETGALLLDLHLPETTPERPLPVVLWIHGGGWKSGSKENCPLTWLAAEGHAVVSLGYRLSGVARWPAPLDDARNALRWLRTNATRFQLDPERIVVAGGSSGANLAGVVGTAPRPAGERVSSAVRGVIDFYGASDVLTMPVNVPGLDRPDAVLAQSNAALLLGGIVRDRPDLARQMSTLYQVSPDDPPFLIIHGDQDPQVPLEQSERLHAKLQATGVPSELVVLKGAGHGGPAFATPAVKQRIRDFLQRSLVPP